MHRILECERQAILDLIEEWALVDRSHRKLAHRGSYTGTVFVYPSTLLRVALKHQVKLPEDPWRIPPPRPALPEVPWERNRIWMWDASHFTRARRVAYAIVDVVTRYWTELCLRSEVGLLARCRIGRDCRERGWRFVLAMCRDLRVIHGLRVTRSSTVRRRASVRSTPLRSS